MQLRHHPHPSAVLRIAAITLVAGGTISACGADTGGPALSATGETGREITRDNGCSACHGRSGEGGPGPAYTGLYGSTVELKDGTTVTADADYLFRAIRDPAAESVAGYGFPMPENDLSDAEIESVIAYIRELADAGEATR